MELSFFQMKIDQTISKHYGWSLIGVDSKRNKKHSKKEKS